MGHEHSSPATLAILVGGGPAPGINGVIASATIEAINNGLRVIGLYDGYRHIARRRHRAAVELTIEEVSRIHFTGGSILRTSRTNPAKDEATLERCVRSLSQLGVRYLRLHRRRRHDLRRDAQIAERHARARSASRPCRRRSTTICRCPTTRRRSASKPRARSGPTSSRA